MISRERRAPGGAATWELGNPPAGLGEPQPAADMGMRACGQWTRGKIKLGGFISALQYLDGEIVCRNSTSVCVMT